MTTLKPFFDLIFFALLFSVATFSVAQPSLDYVTGKALFEKQWVFAPASTGASDGLGPYFNARSCNQCHPGGGRGDADVSRTLHINDPVYGEQLQKFTRPGVPAEAAVSVTWSDPRITGALRSVSVAITDLHYGPLASNDLSLRIAPSLAGLGLLETIPESMLEQLADPDDADGNGISGRLPRLLDGRIGRFGWKASQPDLREQAGRALSLDLGLGNPVRHSAHGDCTPAQVACLAAPAGAGGDSLEVSEQVLELLLTYIRALPAPVPADYTAESIQRGAGLFAEAGCAECHVPEFEVDGSIVTPYTDLLLHDMGPGLADNLAEGAAAGNEWRTPPLWGLDRTGGYLHDGRARNLQEAILWHDGEAAPARQAYLDLNGAERGDVITFLDGL